MATPSMQLCMETSDWLKGIVTENADSSADNSPAAELIPCCARPQQHPPQLERRLRPPHEQQALKCPRCDSTHTKFCYYNNYSLSQPRYFCKTCRRYWTKGGSLRNVPVGGGCRKNKRTPAAKKPTTTDIHQQSIISDQLQLSNLNFMFEGTSHLNFMGSCELGMNTMGFSMDGGNGAAFAEACQRLALPMEGAQDQEDVKPGNRMLSLEWPEQGCGDTYGYGYGNGYGLWSGMINGGGSSSSAAM